VYDARLMLAAQGLPRGGGVGFELFDKGDLGLSDFTQKVNLRRALEGELAKTISHLANVRAARVHLTLGEKGLYKGEDHAAAAAVVVQMQGGRQLGEREVSGIRHLVASSVPALSADGVTIVDAKGTVLSSESTWGEAEVFRERELERSLEAKLVSFLEPVVGAGAVVARVTAQLDNSEVQTSREAVDPQGTLKTEHKTSQSASSGGGPGSIGGVAGAAANQPLSSPAPGAAGPGVSPNSSTAQDETRAFDVGRTVTKTVAHGGRITKLSVALLVDGKDGQPRGDDEIAALKELASKAVGFDPARGDQMEISSQVFTKSTEALEQQPAPPEKSKIPVPIWFGPAALGAVTLLLLMWLLRGTKPSASPPAPAPVLRAGESVAALEAELQGNQLPAQLGVLPQLGPDGKPLPLPVPVFESTPDPNLSLRDRARELVGKDPNRAALLLRAWISADEVA
jgi:flagellar M-ring protein FliF